MLSRSSRIKLLNVHSTAVPLIHTLPRFFDEFQATRVLQMRPLTRHPTENTYSSCCVIYHINKTFFFASLTVFWRHWRIFNTAYLDFMKCPQPQAHKTHFGTPGCESWDNLPSKILSSFPRLTVKSLERTGLAVAWGSIWLPRPLSH